jgi:hypothetical protein
LWKCKYKNRLTENSERVEINFKENSVAGFTGRVPIQTNTPSPQNGEGVFVCIGTLPVKPATEFSLKFISTLSGFSVNLFLYLRFHNLYLELVVYY